MLGGGRDWELRRRRNQFTGALSFFKDNFAGGSHNLKVGGEYLDENGRDAVELGPTPTTSSTSSTAPCRARSRRPRRSTCASRNNVDSWNALATTSLFVTDTWTINRLTLNVGARFDRYRVWLPEQSLAGRPASCRPATDFRERRQSSTFNHIVPRVGATYDLTGDGKTVLKANWGRFYFNPGVNLADAVNENTGNQYADHVLERPQRRPHLPGRREAARRPEVRRRRQRVDRSRTSRTRTPTRPRSSSSAR